MAPFPTFRRIHLHYLLYAMPILVAGQAAQASENNVVPTYSRDVAPILYKNCTGCHRPNDIAPMSLLTYKDARPWAASMRQAVVQKVMPPWHADPHFGKFSNDPRLSDADIATISNWAKGGAPEGNPADLPAKPSYNDDWKIGKPDAIVDIGQDYKVENRGVPDEYTYFTVDTHFTKDTWVTAVELRPGNRRVVHHAHVWMEAPEKAQPKQASASKAPNYFYKDEHGLSHIRPDAPVINDSCQAQGGTDVAKQVVKEDTGPLGSYLPGKGPDIYPVGTAKLIPAGAKLKFQVHYNNTLGTPQTDRTEVGFVFADKPPEHPLLRVDASAYLFVIPPGAPNHEVATCTTFQKDVMLMSYVAHMHFRGKDMRFDLERPNGTRETLLFVPHYSFAWQQIYRLAKPEPVEKGSRLIITAHFDNSANNSWNPDPSKTIRWGEPSTTEMMDGWIEYVDASKPGTETLTAKR